MDLFSPLRREQPFLETAESRPAFVRVSAAVLAGTMVFLLIFPVIALIWRTSTLPGSGEGLGARPILDAILLSLGTTGVSMMVIVILGTPLAYLLARRRFPLKRLVAAFVEMPIIMPPVVAGLALLAAFGRRGLLGQPLGELGIRLPFTVGAVVIAQVFVSAPFFIRAAQARFAGLPRELEEAAMIDGAESWNLFRHITLPLSARALTGGLLLSWARALGEFGATILFAGNLAGRTQTMPLLVYGALEQDLSAAFTTALILLALAGLSIGLLRYLARLDETDRDALAEQW